MKYYAVRKGRNTGIFNTWLDCSKSITGFKGAVFKSFKSLEDAQSFLNDSPIVSPIETPNKTPKNSSLEETLVIFTDGACKSNGSSKAVAGYGVYYGENDSRNISKKLLGSNPTNNRAELMAVIEAINYLDVKTKAIIYTDSQYVQKGLESWLSNWKKRNWKTSKGEPVLNQDLWKILDDYKRKKPLIEIKHVKGHSGILGNEMADKLAVEGCFK